MSDRFFPLSTAGIIRFTCTNVCKNNIQWDSFKIVSKYMKSMVCDYLQ